MKNDKYEFELKEGNAAHDFIQISLYLSLLIFFVLLNINNVASSKYGVNKDALISINKQFGKNNIFFVEEYIIENKKKLYQTAKEYFISKIKNIIPKEAELDILNENDFQLAELQLASLYLFVKDQAQLKNSQKEFLTELSEIMSLQIGGIRLRLNISINCVEFLDIKKSDKALLAASRIAEISSFLINNGAPVDSIIVSISEDLAGKTNFMLSLEQG